MAGAGRQRATQDNNGRAHAAAHADPVGKDADGERVGQRRFTITTFIAVAGLIAAVAIPLYLGSIPSTPEQHVAACRQSHKLPDVPYAPALDRYGQVFHIADCSWPPVQGAEQDGYFTISLQLYNIPGSASANEFTDVMVGSTRCAAVLMQLKFVHQTTNVQEKPLVLFNDQVVSGFDGSSAAIPNALVRQIGPNSDGRLIVLVNNRYDLSRLACTSPPNPPN